ncbi:MAG: orotidine-5'-phosphate decarboxylase [Caldilineaceae bacterium]|nr:orotidine-5'-phosphate decarboxylase [Caldilineaceae bacterium]
MSDFFAKLEAAIQRNNSLLCIGLDPNPDQLPERYRRGESDASRAILAWNQAIIEQTKDIVCCYKPNIAFYEALGAPGMAVLRQTLALIPADIPVILDAKRGDIGSTASAYARACFHDLGVDAVTLSPYLGRDSIDAFAAYQDKGLFVLCHTSNPSASEFQELEIADWRTLDREPNQPLYIHVARAAAGWAPNIALVVGATYPEAIAAVRSAAPETWFLVPGIGAQGGELERTLAAGLRKDGLGLIISASRSIALAADHRAAALEMRDAINGVRQLAAAQAAAPAELSPALRQLIIELADLGAVKFGAFTLVSGVQSPIYIDLRVLVSRPALLARAAEAYVALLDTIDCDRIAGVPYAALPIGTAVAIASDKPLIYPRKEIKEHGLGKLIEGVWQAGERVAIIEDLITSGGSTIKTAEQLRGAGLVVEHAIVLIDREQGGVANLAQAGITAHTVFKLSSMLDVLVESGRLDGAKRTEVLEFLGAKGEGVG